MEKSKVVPGNIIIIGALVLLLAGVIGATVKSADRFSRRPSGKPSLGGATGWLNSHALTLAGLHGKVVLIDFWTYTCINWRRTLPYIRAWADKYKDQGLVVIGVSTPEFSFEYNAGNVSDAPVPINAAGAEAAADWQNLQSSENYVGYGRTGNFSSPGGAVSDRAKTYAAPARLTLNQWALAGDWTMGVEATVLNKADGRMLYCFHARDLHLVMGRSAPGARVRFRVLIDGRVPGADHGVDVDNQGNGQITEPRMYQLIRQQGVIVDRLFEIEFLDPGAATFSFTFG